MWRRGAVGRHRSERGQDDRRADSRQPQDRRPHHAGTDRTLRRSAENQQGTHTRAFNGPLFGTTQVSRYQKGKTNLDLLEQETVSGSGISWAKCKSAPCSRQTTMPAPNYSVFLQAGCPSCRPTNSVKALKE